MAPSDPAWTLREAVAAPRLGLSGAGEARPDRFKPPHRVDQRAAVAVSRVASSRSRICATVSKARAAWASARASLTSKRSITESNASGIPAALGADFGVFRRAIRSRRPAAASSRSSCAPSSCRPRVLVQIRRSRRSLRRANRQGACRRAGRPPRRRRGSAGPRPRYSTPSLYSCPRPSLGGRESPDERRRRRAAILSGVMVKKRLRTRSPSGPARSVKLYYKLQQLSVAISLR